MSTTLTGDLHEQLSRAIDMLRFTMRQFSPEEYITGLDFFDTPARHRHPLWPYRRELALNRSAVELGILI